MKGYFRFTSVMLVLAMLISMLVPTINATTAQADYLINYLDKTATPLDALDQTDVTLTVPGTVEGYIDVVFILGGGMTANLGTIESAISVFEPAMKIGKAVVRVGILSLEKGKELVLDLNSDEAVLDPDTYMSFIAEKLDSINDLPVGCTNLHSQLLEAQNMLAKESLADAENKYVFVLATGRTYWFDDSNGEQATIVNKVKGTDGNYYYYWGHYLWQSQRGGNTSLYMIPAIYNNSYANFLSAIEGWIAADGDKYVYTPHFSTTDLGAYAAWSANNGKDLRALNLSNGRYGNAIVNPKPVASNFISGAVEGIGSAGNPQNALNYERAQYECIQVWKQLIGAGYNCYSICSEAPNYQNNSESIVSKGYTGSSTIQVGHAFMDYLAELSGQGKAPVVWEYLRDANGKVVFYEGYEGNYNYAMTTLKANFFSSIHDDMIYTCTAGSRVVDYIGKNEHGNFEFIENADCIKLVVGGYGYTTAMVADTAFGSSYTFTAPGATEPTFWLDYSYGDGETTEHFVWTFGEDVTTEKLAHLTYKLQLTEKSEISGTYTVPTNNSATFFPLDSNGKPGHPVIFPVPTVRYEVEGIEHLINIFGTKTWIDDDNFAGMRPECIVIRLWDGDREVASITVYESRLSGWNYAFYDLPAYRDGDEIVYTVTEDPVDGYTTVINGYDITNIYIPETINVSGTKTWNDADNQDGKRPESITINLLANGKEIAEANVTAETAWQYTFENLPKYENGTEIVYTITEDAVEGYTATINGFNVTNTYTPETINVSGTKTWNDADNQDGKRPESITINLLANGKEIAETNVTAETAWQYTFENLPKYENGTEIVYTITEDAVEGYTATINGFNVTNTYTPETINLSGTKTWNDADNQDGKRPESITINLLANGKEIAEANVTAETAWQYTFENLPKYENGTEIVYTVTEDAVEGYTATINGFNVTNTYTPETINVSGAKTWNDADNQDGKRPESITINLLANGKEIAEANVTAETAWQYTFENLPKYENGTEIVYTVTEDAVEGYTATINGFNVTNTYTPETINVSGTKTWNDADNQDGKRPESITINLLANGKEIAETNVTAETAWQYTFENLPKYENGTEIVYTITEDAVEGYTATINGFNVTNTYTPETIQVSVFKVWEDENNIDNTRPESITVILYANGVATESKEISALENWEWTFTGLDKYENGTEIVYTIAEVEVENYYSTVTGDMTTGFVITNVYLIEITDNPPPLTPPQTGDAALPVIIVAVLALLAAIWIPTKSRQIED